MKLEPPPGDTNFDGAVDLVDFGRLKKNFGRAEPNLAGDLNYDDVVDLLDFSILKEHFGTGAVDAAPAAENAALAPRGDLAAGAAIDLALAAGEAEEDGDAA